MWVRNGIRIQDFYVPGACAFISCPSSLNNRSRSERAKDAGAADGPTGAGDPRYQLREHRQQEPTWPPLTRVQPPHCPSDALEENWHFEVPQCQHSRHGGGTPASISIRVGAQRTNSQLTFKEGSLWAFAWRRIFKMGKFIS